MENSRHLFYFELIKVYLAVHFIFGQQNRPLNEPADCDVINKQQAFQVSLHDEPKKY